MVAPIEIATMWRRPQAEPCCRTEMRRPQAEPRCTTRRVGPCHPCFIIAEAGVNHNGDIEKAHELVEVAVQAGADAIKFQTFKAERVVTTDAPKADYQVRNTNGIESQYEMLKRLELTEQMHHELAAHCMERGIVFMSTPFDEDSADFLADLGVPVYKVASGEITNLPLLKHIASKGKPMFVSTGMACLGEVETALNAIHQSGNDQVVLLHCVSNYPADPADANLRAMHTMNTAFDRPVGFSDHTQGIEVPLAAVALGACAIEKHFTLDRTLPGPDHAASLEPCELEAMVRGIRIVEKALGHGRKEPADSEANTTAIARRSLVAAQSIPAGTMLTDDLIALRRPGTGLPPALRPHLVGRTLKRDVPAGTLLAFEMLE